MIIIQTLAEMKKISANWLGSVGFVPTMGYLHYGHLQLVKEARQTCDNCIVSIFVNPAQFSPSEDLSSYPRHLDRDVKLLRELDVDFLFFPSQDEIYPKDYKTWVNVNNITATLCGNSRPTHFQGVATILAKLINLVRPDFMFMGEKDYQQLIVTKKMVKDLHFQVQIIGCPVVREKDGLAMSSRNKYLSPTERKQAVCLYQSLILASECVKKNFTDCQKIEKKMRNLIQEKNGQIDYIAFVHPETLESVAEITSDTRVILAVFMGKTRLIDNILIEHGKS